MTGLYIALASLAGIGAIAGGIFFVVLGIVWLLDRNIRAHAPADPDDAEWALYIANSRPLHDAEARDGERGSEGRGFVHGHANSHIAGAE